MKRLKIIFQYTLAILFAVSLMAFELTPLDVICGKERWDVKTLTDKESSKINWAAKQTTVKGLSKLVQPFPVDAKKKNKKFDKSIRFGYEFNVYEIKCRIKEYRKEDDGDYHLVLVDINDTTCTIVGEIVNPLCPNLTSSSFIPAFYIVREQFEKIRLQKNKVKEGTYIVSGVCFFDKIHGQLGISANGVEIHPIMDIVQDIR